MDFELARLQLERTSCAIKLQYVQVKSNKCYTSLSIVVRGLFVLLSFPCHAKMPNPRNATLSIHVGWIASQMGNRQCWLDRYHLQNATHLLTKIKSMKPKGRGKDQEQLLWNHRVMMSEKPSIHWPHVPEMPAMLYPRGGIRVCLWLKELVI